MTHMGSDRGFIYTIFGLGVSHMGIWAGFQGKLAQPGPFMRTTERACPSSASSIRGIVGMQTGYEVLSLVLSRSRGTGRV